MEKFISRVKSIPVRIREKPVPLDGLNLTGTTAGILKICYLILSILLGVLVFVSFSGCKRRMEEMFADAGEMTAIDYSSLLKRKDTTSKALASIEKRICALDKFATGGLIADAETVLALANPTTDREEFERGKPARNEKARTEAAAKKKTALGVDCAGNPLVFAECFANPLSSEGTLAEWKALKKEVDALDKKWRLLAGVLFRWISPTVRGFGKKAGIEAFFSGSADWEKCSTTPTGTETDASQELPPEPQVPPAFKKAIKDRLEKVIAGLPAIEKELVSCEKVRREMEAKKERLERGEITAADISMGAANSPAGVPL